MLVYLQHLLVVLGRRSLDFRGLAATGFVVGSAVMHFLRAIDAGTAAAEAEHSCLLLGVLD